MGRRRPRRKARTTMQRQIHEKRASAQRDPFLSGTPGGPPNTGVWREDCDVSIPMGAESGSAIPAALRNQDAYLLSLDDGWEDEADGAVRPAPKYLVECPGCGAVSDGRRLTPHERRLLRRALCPSCVGTDSLYEQEHYTYTRFQSRHAHDPATPLRTYHDYQEPRSQRLCDEIAASDALRRSMGLPAAGFLCERHGQFKGLMLVQFPVSTLFPTVSVNVPVLDWVVGVDRKTMTWVVVAICLGRVGGTAVYCLDRDLTQAELAAILNVWPQHLATELRHSAKPGWRMLREGRYRVGVEKTTQYFYPSHLVAQVLLGREMTERLSALCRMLNREVHQ